MTGRVLPDFTVTCPTCGAAPGAMCRVSRSTGANVKHEHLITYGGTAPCGATFGTAAGPNDGVTACGNCQVVHPLQMLCAGCGEAMGFVFYEVIAPARLQSP